MLFYKYQKAGNLEFNMLRRGEIYFASVEELNYANECRPRLVFKGSQELWVRLTEFILQSVCFRTFYHEKTSKEDIKKLLSLSNSIGKELKKLAKNKDIGIEVLSTLFLDAINPIVKIHFPKLESKLIVGLCLNFINEELYKYTEEAKYIASFSKNATNPTMWGHYADAEKGFVIVYQTYNDRIKVRSSIRILDGTRPSKTNKGVIEIGKYFEDSLELKTVKYGKKPPKVNAFHRLIPKFVYSEEEDHYDVPLLIGGDAEEKEEEKIGLVKYSDWRYEQEVRAFFPTYEKLAPDIRQLRVSRSNIKGVIFGPKMTHEHKSRIILCCHLLRNSFTETTKDTKTKLSDFVFFQAIQAVERFDFTIEPVGVLSDHYFGRFLPIKLVKELSSETRNGLKSLCSEIMHQY